MERGVWPGRWKRIYADLPVRSLADWTTAYPRRTKLFDDPSAGLATIEAIFAAYTQMGRNVAGLLDDYHWQREFLELNAKQITAGEIPP